MAAAPERQTRKEPDLRVRAATENYAVATLGNCVHLHWRRLIVVDAIRDLEVAMAALAETAPGGRFGFLTTADIGCSSISPPEQRQQLARLLKAQEHSIVAAAIVFEEEGFRATLVRSAITAITLMSRSGFPTRVFASTPPAAAWLAARPDIVVPVRCMLAAVRSLQGPVVP